MAYATTVFMGMKVQYPSSVGSCSVEARMLEYDCPPTPKPREEGKPALIRFQPSGAYCIPSRIEDVANSAGAYQVGLHCYLVTPTWTSKIPSAMAGMPFMLG